MKHFVKFTIAIPCYKQAQYLSEAIESALAQTYYDIEIIVVNDGSPDNTTEVAERYPVKIVNQVNKGLSSARNTAIMNATGDYFLPLDADDLLEPTCVETMARVARETDADIIAPSLTEFGECQGATVILKPDPTIEDFKVGNHIPYASAIKMSALREIGGYSPRMTWGYEDYHLWFDLLKRGKNIVTIPEPLLRYRVKSHSMIHEANAHRDELMAQIRKDHTELFT